LTKNQEEEKGLVIVYTGEGKGKTTAALGLCLRAVGHGNRIRIIQFLKSDWPYGELEGLKRLQPEVDIDVLGAGCVGILDDIKPLEEHRRAAQSAMKIAAEVIRSGKYDIVILDEINVAANLKLITVADILKLIAEKPKQLDLVITGRYADARVIDRADLVTEMIEIKHPFQKGQLAKKGIDF
jgi:cob(I)alamin adenosyltransferase